MVLSQKWVPGVKVCALLLFVITSFVISQKSLAESFPGVDRRAVTIWSQGVRLAGDLYSPTGMTAEQQLPGILLIPGWGESDGPLLASSKLAPAEDTTESTVKARHIRQVVNPFSMSADVRAALHYLGGEPNVIADNLGIWGTSMGGALALVSATSDDRIKAYVDQMGPVNYAYNLKQLPDALMRQSEARAARGEIPPYPGPQSKGDPRLSGYPDWVALKRFSPLDDLNQLQAATLIIDAEDETLFDPAHNGALMYAEIKDRLASRYVTYPGGHYEMYKGENLAAARQEALGWFIQHLK